MIEDKMTEDEVEKRRKMIYSARVNEFMDNNGSGNGCGCMFDEGNNYYSHLIHLGK